MGFAGRGSAPAKALWVSSSHRRPRGAPPAPAVLADRLERVFEVVPRNVAAQDDAGDAGEAVVQSRPDPRVDDAAPKFVRRSEVEHRVEVSGGACGIEAMDVEVDPVGTEEGREDLRH